jgi:uncharacterized protein GlcG (DUF336 family)
MIDITLEMAETAVKAAQAKARALRAPMTVTVVDEAPPRAERSRRRHRLLQP